MVQRGPTAQQTSAWRRARMMRPLFQRLW
jgi:hypothetical protein